MESLNVWRSTATRVWPESRACLRCYDDKGPRTVIIDIPLYLDTLLHYIFVSSISFKVCILGAVLVLDFGWVGENVPLFGLPLDFLGVPNTSPLAF